MPYEPPFQRNNAIDSLCMDITELVGTLPPPGSFSKKSNVAPRASDKNDSLLADD